ncbi:hypothetical protein [Nocardia sp. CS682]|uniref:hypothetical protein n=1 Tax=Nocardia sp. CS682 TaxID=1047172 RepID=UPI00143088B5|nr:hypothetical protein [Nocardia sp. CS682]
MKLDDFDLDIRLGTPPRAERLSAPIDPPTTGPGWYSREYICGSRYLGQAAFRHK